MILDSVMLIFLFIRNKKDCSWEKILNMKKIKLSNILIYMNKEND